MPRLFAGLELPEDIRSELSALEIPIPGVDWLDEDDLHLTLRFFGDVTDAQAGALGDLLDTFEADAFELTITGLSTFGAEPRSLHAVVAATDGLVRLARALDRLAVAVRCQRLRHPFRPHITLARFSAVDPEQIARFLSRHGAIRLPPVFIHRFALFSARPRTGGGPYAVEALYPLRGGLGAGEDEDGNPW